MHWSNIGLLVIAVSNLIVSSIVWRINPRNKINLSFALNHLLLAGWAFSLALFRESSSLSWAQFWVTLQSIFAGTAIIPLFFFSIYFPHQHYVLKNAHKVIIALSALIVVSLSILPGAWINGIVLKPHQNEFTLNFFSHLYYVIYFFVFMVFGLHNLIKKFLRSDGFTRVQLVSIVPGFVLILFVSAFVGILGSLITLSSGFVWLVPYFILPTNIAALYLIFFAGKR